MYSLWCHHLSFATYYLAFTFEYSLFAIYYWLCTVHLFTINHALCRIYWCFPRFTIYYSFDSRGCNDGTPCEHHGKIMSNSKFRRRSRRSSTNVHGMQFLVAGQPSAPVDIGEWYVYDTMHDSLFATLYYLLCTSYVLQPLHTSVSLFTFIIRIFTNYHPLLVINYL